MYCKGTRSEEEADESATDADEDGDLAGFIVDDIEYYNDSDSAPRKKKGKMQQAKRTHEKPVSAAQTRWAERAAYKQNAKLKRRRNIRQLKLFDRMVGDLYNEPIKLRTEDEALFVRGVRALTRELDADKGYCSDTGIERARSSIRALNTTYKPVKLLSVVRRDSDNKPLIVVENLPECAKCPITQDLLNIPMTDVRTGHTFERDAILRWLEINQVNPLNRAPLRKEDLFFNRPLQKALLMLV
jgi:hypothetical protein